MRVEDVEDERKLAELYDFLELPTAPRERALETLAQRVNDMTAAEQETARLRGFEVAPFSDWSSADRAALERICGATGRRLGYDQY